MYISEVSVRNFRGFGNVEQVIPFNPGLTVFVGENDSGKTTVIDAIRFVLGTTDASRDWLVLEDFHDEDDSQDISIVVKFMRLTKNERAAFLEYLTHEDPELVLYLHYKAHYSYQYTPPRAIIEVSTGKDGSGSPVSQKARELLRVTYLKPLRDTYHEMQSGRYSRLSQILQKHPQIGSGKNKYAESQPLSELSLVGIADLANTLLKEHQSIKEINTQMNDILSRDILLRNDDIRTKFVVAGEKMNDRQKLKSMLEKIDLVADRTSGDMRGFVGLGTSNIMGMACELLLYETSEQNSQSTYLLIEEPEAHIHAQRQLKLIQTFQESIKSSNTENKNHQIILTTHSPLFASVVKLDNLVLMKGYKAYPMGSDYTKLSKDDYGFLEKFLDATKANMFFARSIIIVEGTGEALLLPTIANLLDKSFSDYGVSLVNVMGIGLRRYAKIFQRKIEDERLDVRVACLADRDIKPDCTKTIFPGLHPKFIDKEWKTESDFTDDVRKTYLTNLSQRAGSDNVMTFISDHWTFEYDLAYKGFTNSEMKAVLIESLARVMCSSEDKIEDKTTEISDDINGYSNPDEQATAFYAYFYIKGASKADFAQQMSIALENKFNGKAELLKNVLPDYILNAFDYIIA
ncbi:ATP-dependent nuclease [Sphaerochaeta sp.]|jgi:putative ATP-dependent endonuclease of OLD family|uniref:ATP-dependent nuclease n=1 Tax=Sphaerochaeta sp. TaxID=1972642 RepID=UPI002A35B422|nr:AAA family ATPase [Sphaerochaeta sp.]MDX9984846.1 AAA family ATPase [Sphaerochaeta sp.]